MSDAATEPTPTLDLIPGAPASSLDTLAAAISTIADFGLAVVVVEGIAVLRKRRSPLRAALRLSVVGFSVLGLNTLLKRTVGRERPEGAESPTTFARVPSSPSFPSGHTMAAATAAVAIPTTPVGLGLGLAGAGAVGWSRLRLGAHHTSDVVGGLAIGIAIGTLLRAVLRTLERRA
jgi:undecaprenyl-diphosphatase